MSKISKSAKKNLILKYRDKHGNTKRDKVNLNKHKNVNLTNSVPIHNRGIEAGDSEEQAVSVLRKAPVVLFRVMIKIMYMLFCIAKSYIICNRNHL